MSDYLPIRCDLHDELESLSVLRKLCDIRFQASDGQVKSMTGRIDDVFARAGEEFVKLDSGDVIRLDRLLAVDGKPFGGTCS